MFGYRYQCGGFFQYQLTIDQVSGPHVENNTINFGHAFEDDSYEEPKVMACCPAFDPDLPACAQPHSQACVVDLAEQGCKTIAYELKVAANNASTEFDKEAINKAAEYVAEHQQDCYDAFAMDSGVIFTDPACDPDLNGVDYAQLAVGASWSFNPPGLVPNVTVEITDAEVPAIFPWVSDPEFPGDTCKSSDENDGVSLLVLDPADPVYKLKHGTAEVRGDNLLDSASLDSTRTSCGDHCSGVSITEDAEAGTAQLHWLLALGEQIQTVDGFQIDKFRAELQGPIPAVSDGQGGYELAAGDALFALSGSAMGTTSIAYASNLRPIYFRWNGLAWDIDPIHVVYTDPSTGDAFEFFVGPTTWQ